MSCAGLGIQNRLIFYTFFFSKPSKAVNTSLQTDHILLVYSHSHQMFLVQLSPLKLCKV